jgi:hypothetical protein
MDNKSILFSIALLIAVQILTGCNKQPLLFDKLSCQLAVTKKAKCSSGSTLDKGVLEISPDHFELNVRYDACFHIEDLRIRGRVNLYQHDHEYLIELLGTHFEKVNGSANTFPRTVAFIHLDTDSLRGSFTDILSVIKDQGRLSQIPTFIELSCKRE